MELIENYKLKDLFKQPSEKIEEYVNILQHLEPIETKRQVFDMKLKHVEYIKQNINTNDDSEIIKIISRVQRTTDKEVLKMPIVTFFGLWNSIKKQIKHINELETKSLTSKHTNLKWEAIEGSERIAKFGIYNVLNMLSKDITKHKAILNLPYSHVFTILYLNTVNNDLQIEMDKLNIPS